MAPASFVLRVIPSRTAQFSSSSVVVALFIGCEIEASEQFCESGIGAQAVNFRSNFQPIQPFILSRIGLLKPFKGFVSSRQVRCGSIQY